MRSKNLVTFVATAIAPLMAPTAEAADQPRNQLEEIIVTAQKREESVQDVPISISAISSEELQNRSVSQISDLQSATPNVTFSTTQQGTLASTVGIRGLRNSNIELVNDQPSAIYIDDVYQSTAIGSMAFLGPDVERVEVLRGPQGTLFGRNTIGGAVAIHTKRPKSDEFSSRIMIGAGNHGILEGQGMVNIPIVKDVVAARLNVGYRDDNGFAKDRTYGNRLGQSEQIYARGQLRIEPNDRLDMLLSADFVEAKTEGNLLQPVFLSPNSPAVSSLALLYGLPATDFAAIQSRFFACGGGPTPTLKTRCWSPAQTNPVTTTGKFYRAASMADESVYREWGVAGNVDYRLTDNIAIKSITSFRHFYHDSPKDYDGTESILLFSRATPEGDTFTQELQLNGTLLDSRIKYTVGGYYYNFDGVERGTNTALGNLTGSNGANYLENNLENESVGFFNQTTFSLTDQLNLTGGIRYTTEDKDVAISQFGSRATAVGYACTLPLPNAACVNTAALSYEAWDWTAGADYTPVQGMMFYVRAAEGFQAGGINQRSTTGVPFQTYLPMTAINYEIGFKSSLLDRRLTLNVSAFQTDVKDFQRVIPATFLDLAGNPVTVVATLNAATATLRGVEAEATWIPFDNARISAQVGYTDPKWNEFLADGPNGPKTLDLSHTDFQQISKLTYGISPSYTLPTSFGEIHFQVDYSYQSRQNLAPSLSFPRDVELPVPGLIQQGFGLLNARVAVRTDQDTEIAVWGKNLTDERYFTSGLNLAANLGFANATVGNPLTVGVQVSQKF